METLSQLHKRALAESWAMPHFNFSTLEQLNGILDALKELKSPAVLGTSESERDFIGLNQAIYLIKSFREKEGLFVFLNADHTRSLEVAKKAFDAGYDSIHIDLSKKLFKENLEITKAVVDYVKSKNSDTEVEGELGFLVTDSSRLYKEVIEIPQESYTKVDEAIEFVQKTGIDRFAPAVGNLHGISANEPQISFDLVKKLRDVLPKDLTFVLHGGSGISDEDLRRLVEAGFNNIHISTELRLAYTNALRKNLSENTEELAPYKYLEGARKAVYKVVKQKLAIFGCIGKI